jgi:flagellar protein FliL
MAANRPESPAPGEGDKTAASSPAPASAAPAVGGMKAWLPLVASIVLMPLMAYLTTTFFLLPKQRSEAATPPASAPASGGGEHGKSEKEASHGGTDLGLGKSKFTAPLGSKVLVNLAGTLGTRYLLANITLVSPQASLKDLVERNDAELRDVAASVLATKTISDLEKPGARNLIRTELISVFNNVLGDGLVTELYLTEFAIQ